MGRAAALVSIHYGGDRWGNGHSEEWMGAEMRDGWKRVWAGAVAPEARLHAISSHSFRGQHALLLSNSVDRHLSFMATQKSARAVGFRDKE